MKVFHRVQPNLARERHLSGSRVWGLEWFSALVALLVLSSVGIGCVGESSQAEVSSPVTSLPRASASSAFWDHWSDNRGEVSAYSVTTPRYGELRDGTIALVYVLEQADSRTWIKDDRGETPSEHQTIVMKLNEVMSFRTGIYPYRVMTSVFAPVNGIGRERFAPTRITFSSQEWCGQVFQRVMPDIDHFTEEIRSYFSVEGEASSRVDTAPFALYENGLLIQLRELDGPFADGGDWSGQIVPSMWQRRRSHEPLGPVDATITRAEVTEEDGTNLNRFVLRYGDYERTFDVERDQPRRIHRWTTSEGEVAELLGTERLTYWELHNEGDESYLARIGLDANGQPIQTKDD